MSARLRATRQRAIAGASDARIEATDAPRERAARTREGPSGASKAARHANPGRRRSARSRESPGRNVGAPAPPTASRTPKQRRPANFGLGAADDGRGVNNAGAARTPPIAARTSGEAEAHGAPTTRNGSR